MRSGYISLAGTNGAIFRFVGQWGYDRSSRGSDAATHAYILHFGGTEVNSSAGPYSRYHAFPLRCLSTVLGMGGKVCSKLTPRPCGYVKTQ